MDAEWTPMYVIIRKHWSMVCAYEGRKNAHKTFGWAIEGLDTKRVVSWRDEWWQKQTHIILWMRDILRDHAINAPSIKWSPPTVRTMQKRCLSFSQSLRHWDIKAQTTNEPNSKAKPNETKRNKRNESKHSTGKSTALASSSNHFAFKIKCTIEMSMKMNLWKFHSNDIVVDGDWRRCKRWQNHN